MQRDVQTCGNEPNLYPGNGVRFVIIGLTKTRRNRPPMKAFYSAFSDEPKLYPVQALECYEKRSKGLWSKPGNTHCLLYKPGETDTMGSWLKGIMTY